MIATKLMREVYRAVSLFHRFLGAHCQSGKLTPYDDFAVASAVYAISQGRKPLTPEALMLMLHRHNGGLLAAGDGGTFVRVGCSYVPGEKEVERYYAKYGRDYYDLE
jgi:hypothetical protein